MEKLITKTSQITTTIISNATGKNTYAIERTLWQFLAIDIIHYHFILFKDKIGWIMRVNHLLLFVTKYLTRKSDSHNYSVSVELKIYCGEFIPYDSYARGSFWSIIITKLKKNVKK